MGENGKIRARQTGQQRPQDCGGGMEGGAAPVGLS